MKERISALMDGEADRREADGSYAALGTEAEARQAWRTYHLIGDVMRDTGALSPGFNARLSARLEREPTVLAPARPRWRSERPRWRFMPVAASVAAVALVGAVYFNFNAVQQAEPQVAKAPAKPAAEASQVVQVAPPETADDYLLAHQVYSPRVSLQGMAPYVRVANEGRGTR